MLYNSLFVVSEKNGNLTTNAIRWMQVYLMTWPLSAPCSRKMKVQTNQTTGGEEEVREGQQGGTLGIVVSVTMTTKLATMNR